MRTSLRLVFLIAALTLIAAATPSGASAGPMPRADVQALAPGGVTCDGPLEIAHVNASGERVYVFTTVVGSEIVENLFTDGAGSRWALFDACGTDVLPDNYDEEVKFEITSRPPPLAGQPNPPGTLAGYPGNIEGCEPGDISSDKIECVWGPDGSYISTVYFMTEVVGQYVITVTMAGYRPFNLCIDAETNVGFAPTGGVAEACVQPPATPALTANASAGITLGGDISDSATVAFGASPTGTITFKAFGPDDADCSDPAAFTDGVTVAGNGTYDSDDFTPSAAGTYRWTAAYSGDANNEPASAACNASGQSVVVARSSTTTALTSDTNPAVIGDLVTFTATVSPVDTALDTPTGTVQFKVNGIDAGAPVALDTNGQAMLTRTFLSRGARNITAVYAGDAWFAPSASLTLRQKVQRIPTSVVIDVTPNPGLRGEWFTLSADVAPQDPYTGVPGGAVKFFIDGVAVSNWRPLTAGEVSYTRRLFITRGAHDVTAVYRGTAKFKPSSSGVQVLTVN